MLRNREEESLRRSASLKIKQSSSKNDQAPQVLQMMEVPDSSARPQLRKVPSSSGRAERRESRRGFGGAPGIKRNVAEGASRRAQENRHQASGGLADDGEGIPSGGPTQSSTVSPAFGSRHVWARSAPCRPAAALRFLCPGD